MNLLTDNQHKFGFKSGQGGAHASRTIMLAELELLFAAVPPEAPLEQYQQAIELYNVLHKNTSKTRTLTFRHLVELYGLNPQLAMFRALRRLWLADEEARPLLACQMALTRDPLLRLSLSRIQALQPGEQLTRESMEQVFQDVFPDRFSPATRKSLAQNVNASWTAAGYLRGKTKKYCTDPEIRPANLAFALFLGYLQGASGSRLFSNEWVKLLGCRLERLYELARLASYAGLISFKHASEVVEVTFPDYLTKEEETWLYG